VWLKTEQKSVTKVTALTLDRRHVFTTRLGHKQGRKYPPCVLRQEHKVDPRFSIARTYDVLEKAGLNIASFESELNNCTGPENALEICAKWRNIASKVSA
jgi:hypothetical protein